MSADVAADADVAAVPADASPADAPEVRSGWDRYWFEAIPPARMDLLVRIVLGVLIYTVVDHDRWVLRHGWAPDAFYRPTALARWIHLPAPTETTIMVAQWAVIVTAVVALFRKAPRLSCAAVLVSYTVWVLWSFGWAKVDHDRLTIWVALLIFALTPRTGPDAPRSTGWGLRVIQVVFALSYPMSALSKFEKAGLDWPSSYVFTMAIVRRGTAIGKWLLEVPQLLIVSQWGFIVFEVLAVLLVLPQPKIRRPVLVGVFFLHFFTWIAISIHFLPHSIFLLAFLPLERWRRLPGLRRADRGASAGGPEGSIPDAGTPTVVSS